jgi:hypothetical protein
MSREPGTIQRAILNLLYEARGGYISWDDLKRPFPFEVFDKSFYRAVRALKKKGEIEDLEIGGNRYIALPPGRSKEDRELLAMSRQLMNNLAALARSRGLPEKAVQEILAGADVDDYKHHIFSGE